MTRVFKGADTGIYVVLLALVLGPGAGMAGLQVRPPAQLLIDAQEAPQLNAPITLNLSLISQLAAQADFELQLSAAAGLDVSAHSKELSGSLLAGERRTVSVKVTPKDVGDFRIRVRASFKLAQNSTPFIAENSAVIRVRATERFGDVFVDQKEWAKQYLHDQIKRIKAELAEGSQIERDRQLNDLQNAPWRLDEHRVSAETLERQTAYLESANESRKLFPFSLQSDAATLKQQWLGPDNLGHLGSIERYAGVDGLVRRNIPVGFVYRKELFLRAGERYTFETRNLTPGADTVAYLMALDELTEEWTQLARNDDADETTLGSRIEYVPETDGVYMLVVRGYNEQTRGEADLYLNDSLVERARFAGVAFRVTSDPGDVIQTVGLRRSPNRTDTLIFVSSDAGGVWWDDDSGMELGSKLVLPALSNAELVIGAPSSALEGKCDLILNTSDGTSGAHPRGDLDGDGLSNELERALGTRVDSQDSDNDGFLDSWEVLGVRDTDYPGMAANAVMGDLYVQIDWMASTHDHKPRAQAIQMIVDSFALTGITLHVDDGNPDEGGQGHLLPDPWTHLQYLTLGATFNQIKAANFDFAKRGGLYHYNIHAHQQSPGNCSSGIANIRGFNFLVTLGCGAGQIGTVFEQAGTFMHELGHNLSLRHGGFQDLNYKPNYRSVMNYEFQFPGTCGTLGYTTGITFVPCFSREYFYSFNTGFDLDENCLDENAGIGEGPLDWNRDGQIDECVSADINHPAGGAPDGRFELLRDYDDYGNLLLVPAGFASDRRQPEEENVTCAPVSAETE